MLTGIRAISGEYLELHESQHHLVKGLIYPVPDPSVPFLGVHFTPTMGSVTTGARRQVLVGPNAVLATSREGYSWGHVNLRDLIEAASFPGLWHLGLKHWRFALGEMFRSLVLPAQMKDIRMYLPEVKSSHLRRGRAGVRAQALNPDGALVDDFIFDGESATNVTLAAAVCFVSLACVRTRHCIYCARPCRGVSSFAAARAECALARRHELSGNRRNDCGQGNAPLWLVAEGDAFFRFSRVTLQMRNLQTLLNTLMKQNETHTIAHATQHPCRTSGWRRCDGIYCGSARSASE